MTADDASAVLVGVCRGRYPMWRLVVDDPDSSGRVVVKFRPGTSPPWTCAAHGPMTRAACAHTFAAALLLADELLGLDAAAAPNDQEGSRE